MWSAWLWVLTIGQGPAFSFKIFSTFLAASFPVPLSIRQTRFVQLVKPHAGGTIDVPTPAPGVDQFIHKHSPCTHYTKRDREIQGRKGKVRETDAFSICTGNSLRN